MYSGDKNKRVSTNNQPDLGQIVFTFLVGVFVLWSLEQQLGGVYRTRMESQKGDSNSVFFVNILAHFLNLTCCELKAATVWPRSAWEVWRRRLQWGTGNGLACSKQTVSDWTTHTGLQLCLPASLQHADVVWVWAVDSGGSEPRLYTPPVLVRVRLYSGENKRKDDITRDIRCPRSLSGVDGTVLHTHRKWHHKTSEWSEERGTSRSLLTVCVCRYAHRAIQYSHIVQPAPVSCLSYSSVISLVIFLQQTQNNLSPVHQHSNSLTSDFKDGWNSWQVSAEEKWLSGAWTIGACAASPSETKHTRENNCFPAGRYFRPRFHQCCSYLLLFFFPDIFLLFL